MDVQMGADATVPAVEWLNLDTVVVRNKTTNDPMIVLKATSSSGKTSALAVEIFEQVSAELGLGSTRPLSLKVGPVPGNKGAILGVPALERSQAHLPIRWVENGTRALVNFRKLFTLWPFEVPKGSKAHVPVSRMELPTLGPCIVFHFNRAEFQEIEPAKQKSARR